MTGEHQFDRRTSDVNVQALAIRIGSLEARVEVMEHDTKANTRELAANTLLTEQIHGQSAEMFEAYTVAKNGVRVITWVGDKVVKTAEVAGKVAKPLFWTVLLIGSLIGFFKTGEWHWPN